MNKILPMCIVALGFSPAAFAGSPSLVAVDAPVVADTTSGVTDWSGFYAGGLASFDSGTLEYANPPGSAPYTQFTYNDNTSYGGFAGYNIQHGKMVYGVEVAYNSGGIYAAPFLSEATTYTADLKGRAGYAVGKALVYGVFGYSMTNWTTDADYNAGGLSYGVGVDYMVGENLFVGVEYLARDMRGVKTDGSNIEGRSQLQSAQIRVGWKF